MLGNDNRFSAGNFLENAYMESPKLYVMVDKEVI